MEKINYKGMLTDFPKEVVEKMLYHQEQQGNKRDITVFEEDRNCLRYNGGFDWSYTIDGEYFWHSVIEDKKFDIFFEKYPKACSDVEYLLLYELSQGDMIDLFYKRFKTKEQVIEALHDLDNTHRGCWVVLDLFEIKDTLSVKKVREPRYIITKKY